MANSFPLKDFLTKEVIRKLDKTTSIFRNANRAFEWQLKKQWQTIFVSEYQSFDMDRGITLWEDIPATDWSIDEHSLTIDQTANKNLKVKDIELVRSNLSLDNWLASRIAEAIWRMKDQYTAVTAVTWVADSNKLKEYAPETLTKVNVIDEIAVIAQTLEQNNVDLDAWNTTLYINPEVKRLIWTSNLVTWFDKWLKMRIKGFAWELHSFNVVSTNNLPFKQSLTLSWQPIANDTLWITVTDIKWVTTTITFTFKASAAAAWDVTIWWDKATTQQNLINAIKWIWTWFVDVSEVNRKHLLNANVALSAFNGSDVAWVTAWRYIVLAEWTTNLTLWTPSRIMFAMQTNSVNVPFQFIDMKTTGAEKWFYSSLLWEEAWGWAVLWSNALRIATYEMTNWLTVL